MSRTRRVWVWDSPDGTMVFGTARRAKDYAERCGDGPVTWKEINDGWSAFLAGNDDEYEPDIRIYQQDVH